MKDHHRCDLSITINIICKHKAIEADEYFMQKALEQAQIALEYDEVPGVWSYLGSPISAQINPLTYGDGVYQFDYEVFGIAPCSDMTTASFVTYISNISSMHIEKG